MALLAGLAWQGLDGIVRSRDGSRAVLDRTLRLNTVITQWEQDLLALQDVGSVPPLTFDGQTLRLTRRVDGGIVLVAWSVRGGVWQRWSSPVLQRVGGLQEAWLRSQQLIGNEPGQLSLLDASDWQVYFFRGNAWTNAQSTGDLVQAAPVVAPPVPASAASGAAPSAAAPVAAREQLPNAVRLVIRLGGQSLTRDIALGPGGT